MLKFFKRILYAFKESINSYPEIYPLKYGVDVDVEMAVNDFLQINNEIKEIAISKKSKYITFIQPVNTLGKKKLSKFDNFSISHLNRFITLNKKTQLELIKDFYMQLEKKKYQDKNIINLRYIFDDYLDEIYLDHVHFADIGNLIIAKKIAEKIVENIDS